MSESPQDRGGERRRRREEERLRALAAQEAAQRVASAPPAGAGPARHQGGVAAGAQTPAPAERPLSRRELRERAEAAAAHRAAAAQGAATQGAAVVHDPPPAQQPALSRRQIRAAATGEVQGPGRAHPQVQPPALTGGIRRVSAEGVLSDVERTTPKARSGPSGSPEGNASLASPQARAAAVRAQAARAQAEREEQARANASRAQAQRSQRPGAERTEDGKRRAVRDGADSRRADEPAESDRAVPEGPDQGRALHGRAVHERALRERAAQERAAQRRAEQERAEQERAQREREQEQLEQADRARAQQEQRALATRAQHEQAERAQAEREQAEREQAEREQTERAQAEREQAEREQTERVLKERVAQERAEREQVAHVRAEHERAQRERAQREQAQRDHAAQERLRREQIEQERAAREQAAREQAAREQAAREHAEAQRAAQMRQPTGDGRSNDLQRPMGMAERGGPGDRGPNPKTSPPGRVWPGQSTAEPRSPQETQVLTPAMARTPRPQPGTAAEAAPMAQSAWGASPQPGAMAPALDGGGRIAVVPAGRIPRVGQTFGSMSLPASKVQAERPVAVPRWSDVAPAPWTPTPVAGVAAEATAEDATPAPEVDDEPQHAGHPYTWIHMVVLVLVAFVLGMLIFMVVTSDLPNGGAQGAGSPTPVVAQAASAWTILTTGE